MSAMERTNLRRRTLLASGLAALIAAASLGGAGAAAADPVDLAVVDRGTNRPLQVWPSGGRLFVAGQTGSRYALRVTNNTAGRVLVVLSVDGVNIVSGETAGYDQRGYILEPHRSYDLTGWRKSTTEVAAFTFAPLSRSYAARTGRPSDVGVIGMAVFSERVVRASPVAPPVSPRDRREGSGSALQRPAPPPAAAPQVEMDARGSASSRSLGSGRAIVPQQEERLGTGHGQSEWSVSQVRPFERASPNPFFVTQIEYDSRDNLITAGIIPAPRGPRPFPATPGFVPDPPRY